MSSGFQRLVSVIVLQCLGLSMDCHEFRILRTFYGLQVQFIDVMD